MTDQGEHTLRPESAGLTDVGLKRTQNEDATWWSDDAGLYVVADGMGGHAHGEVASALAVETIAAQYAALNTEPAGRSPAERLVDAIREANRRVHTEAAHCLPSPEDRDTIVTGAGMATTVAALAISDRSAIIAHVGDSRVYRLRQGQLDLLTRDHSWAAMAASQFGLPVPETSGFKHLLARAVGLDPEVDVDVREEACQPGDLFLLCSDGLSNMVPDAQIKAILIAGAALPVTCQALVAEANRQGGRDNISCLLVRIPVPPSHGMQ